MFDPSSLPASLPLDPGADPAGFFALALEAVKSGDGWLVAALALVGATYLFRALFGARLPFFKTDLGGTLLAFLLGFFGAAAAALAAGEGLSFGLFLDAAKIAFAAIGGYSSAKKFAAPLLVQAAAKAGLSVPPETLERALAAGRVAASNKPSDPLGAIVGKGREVL